MNEVYELKSKVITIGNRLFWMSFQSTEINALKLSQNGHSHGVMRGKNRVGVRRHNHMTSYPLRIPLISKQANTMPIIWKHNRDRENALGLGGHESVCSQPRFPTQEEERRGKKKKLVMDPAEQCGSHCWVGVSQLRVNATPTMAIWAEQRKHGSSQPSLFSSCDFNHKGADHTSHHFLISYSDVSTGRRSTAEATAENLLGFSRRATTFQSIPRNKVYLRWPKRM